MFAISTDNEAKMGKMRELALKEYPAALTYGCIAHYMSLFEKGVGSTGILKQIIAFQKCFSCTWTVKGEKRVHATVAQLVTLELAGCMLRDLQAELQHLYRDLRENIKKYPQTLDS